MDGDAWAKIRSTSVYRAQLETGDTRYLAEVWQDDPVHARRLHLLLEGSRSLVRLQCDPRAPLRVMYALICGQLAVNRRVGNRYG